ncbi:hypothetical protein G6F40_016510 [Rhizopus arrhizus]|nr:hypothetical protein G6F40_016510 [Rhizopus arrhizus]
MRQRPARGAQRKRIIVGRQCDVGRRLGLAIGVAHACDAHDVADLLHHLRPCGRPAAVQMNPRAVEIGMAHQHQEDRVVAGSQRAALGLQHLQRIRHLELGQLPAT